MKVMLWQGSVNAFVPDLPAPPPSERPPFPSHGNALSSHSQQPVLPVAAPLSEFLKFKTDALNGFHMRHAEVTFTKRSSQKCVRLTPELR